MGMIYIKLAIVRLVRRMQHLLMLRKLGLFNMENRQFGENKAVAWWHLWGGDGKDGARLFMVGGEETTDRNWNKTFRLHIRQNFFTRTVNHWTRMLRETEPPPFLGIFKTQLSPEWPKFIIAPPLSRTLAQRTSEMSSSLNCPMNLWCLDVSFRNEIDKEAVGGNTWAACNVILEK